ncbi:MAG: c-type cytochrome biogenesis protein CcmI [Rhodocyclaceae bacterium]|nr:c-type cytochrome biogenesis protein CcmI [Rhodocyclaceae bacterium]
MIGFLLGAAFLLALTLIILSWPLWRRAQVVSTDRRAINAALYRDELAELKQDLETGALSRSDYEEAYAELQRRLLEDAAAQDDMRPARPSSPRKPWIALAAGITCAAIALYALLGNPAALTVEAKPQHRVTAADIERMVSALAARLEKEPSNTQGWIMLARSYKALGRFEEAARTYRRIEGALADNADLLLDYADVLAAARRGFDDEVLAIIDKALALVPDHPQGLWLRGTAHYEAERYAQALADWQKLYDQLPKGSEAAMMMAANLAELREKMKQPKTAPAPAAKP